MENRKTETPEINTQNDFLLSFGSNLPNHSMTLAGKGKFVRQSVGIVPTFRTRQEAFRYASWLIELADMLPDEEGCESHTFEEVRKAIRNT